jgi:hypothetical protein
MSIDRPLNAAHPRSTAHWQYSRAQAYTAHKCIQELCDCTSISTVCCIVLIRTRRLSYGNELLLAFIECYLKLLYALLIPDRFVLQRQIQNWTRLLRLKACVKTCNNNEDAAHKLRSAPFLADRIIRCKFEWRTSIRGYGRAWGNRTSSAKTKCCHSALKCSQFVCTVDSTTVTQNLDVIFRIYMTIFEYANIPRNWCIE